MHNPVLEQLTHLDLTQESKLHLLFKGVDGAAAEDGGDHQGADDAGAGGPLLSARLGLQRARTAGKD